MESKHNGVVLSIHVSDWWGKVESIYLTLLHKPCIKSLNFDRVTPCILFHITAAVPAIWVLELTEVEKRSAAKQRNETYQCHPVDPVTLSRDTPFESVSDWASLYKF